MRLLLAVLLILIAVSGACAQGWQWQYPYPQGNDLYSVACHSDNGLNGWIVGMGGALLHVRADSSLEWRSFPARSNLMAVIMPTPDAAFVTTLEGSIYRSTNNGQSWEQVYSDTALALRGVSFSSPRNGWAAGGYIRPPTWPGVMIHTTDGGDSWTAQGSDTLGSVGYAFALNDSVCWASGFARLYRTTDAGAHWTFLAVAEFQSMYFTDVNHGWGINGGRIMQTTDGGITWNALQAPNMPADGWTTLTFANADTALAFATDGFTYTTTDGGVSWLQSEGYVQQSIIAADASCYPFSIGAGVRGGIYTSMDGGTEWLRLSSEAAPGALLRAVSFSDPRNGWAVGQGAANWTGNVILHTNDGGQHWEQQFTGWEGCFWDVCAVDSSRAYIGADGGAIMVTTNAGASWMAEYTATDGTVSPVQFLDTNNGFAQSVFGMLLKTTNAGRDWDALPGMPMGGSHSMKFVNLQDGWVTTGGGDLPGQIFRTSDGGLSWNLQGAAPSPFADIDLCDVNHGWAVGGAGEALNTVNGETWTQITPFTSDHFVRVHMVDANNVFIIANRRSEGVVWATTDAGLTWTSQYLPGTENGVFTDMCVLATGDGWAVGYDENGGGNIFHSSDFPELATPPARPVTVVRSFTLSAFPNPFNPNTVLSFDIPRSSRVKISVYDITGRLVQTLADRVYPQGNFRITFDGSNLSSGIYFARLQGNSFSKTQKLVLLK